MAPRTWGCILAAGVAWAAVYNGLWGLAWTAFRRRAWTRAATAAGRPMPWTPEFWVVWLPLTLPFGLVVGAYLLTRPDAPARQAAAAGLVVCLPGTVGMALGAALTPGLIVLDSVANLAAVLVPSLMLAEAVRRRTGAARRPPPRADGQRMTAAG